MARMIHWPFLCGPLGVIHRKKPRYGVLVVDLGHCMSLVRTLQDTPLKGRPSRTPSAVNCPWSARCKIRPVPRIRGCPPVPPSPEQGLSLPGAGACHRIAGTDGAQRPGKLGPKEHAQQRTFLPHPWGGVVALGDEPRKGTVLLEPALGIDRLAEALRPRTHGAWRLLAGLALQATESPRRLGLPAGSRPGRPAPMRPRRIGRPPPAPFCGSQCRGHPEKPGPSSRSPPFPRPARCGPKEGSGNQPASPQCGLRVPARIAGELLCGCGGSERTRKGASAPCEWRVPARGRFLPPYGSHSPGFGPRAGTRRGARVRPPRAIKPATAPSPLAPRGGPALDR